MEVLGTVLRFIAGATCLLLELDDMRSPGNLRSSRNQNLGLAVLTCIGVVLVIVLAYLLRKWGLL